MRLLIVALLFTCARASPQYVKTAGVKGGHSGHAYPYGGESYASNTNYYHNNTAYGYGGYTRTNLTEPNYEKGVCYIEVPTVSLVRDPTHVPAGNGSRPDLSRIRSCCRGYVRNIHNFRICDPVCTHECVNGLCVAPDTCSCFPDHVKNLAGFCVPTCPIGCQNGYCSGGECICKEGYRLDSESKFCVPYCRQQCGGVGGGNCTGPDTCECKNGLKLSPDGSCKPACDKCMNGDCVGPNECRCRPGYAKNQNGDCEPQCSPSCPLRSCCIAPNVCGDSSNMPSTGATHCSYGPPPNSNGQQPQYPNYPGHQQPNYPGHQQPKYPGSQQPNYGGNQQPNYPGNQQPNYPGSQQPNYPGSQQPYNPGSQPSNYPGNQQPSSPYNPPSNYPGNQPSYYPGNPQSNYPGNQQPNYSGSAHYPGSPPSNQTGNPQNRPGTHPSSYPGSQYNHSSSQPTNYPGQRPSYNPDGTPIYVYIPNNQPHLIPDSQHGNPDQRPHIPSSNSSQPNTGTYYPNSQYYPGSQYYPERPRPDTDPGSQHRPNYPGNQHPGSNSSNLPEPYYPNSQYYPNQQNYPYDQNNYQNRPDPNHQYPGYPYPQGEEYQHNIPDSQSSAVEMLCSRPCVNGTCIARDTCACKTGYVPIDSDTTRCTPYCTGCSNGVCVSPYVCVCNPGFYKDFSVKGRSPCIRRIRRSVDETSAPLDVASLLVFEIPDDYIN